MRDTICGAVAGLAATFLLASCASTVDGTGSGGPTTATSAAQPSDFATTPTAPTAAPTTVFAPTAAASTAASSAPSTPTPTPSPTPQPQAVKPPAACSTAACKVVSSAALAGGYVVVLRGDAGANGGAGISVLELKRGGVAVFWVSKAYESPAELACSSTPALRCIAVDYDGAHAAVGRLWKIVGDTLVSGGEVDSATPEMRALDLNGDGYVDVAALQNNYDPDYATGKVQWQTFVSDGSALKSTGCGPLSSGGPPVPSTPQHGACAQ